MRIIDADALMETLQRLADEAKRNSEYRKMQGLYYAKDEVREAPTVEAIPIEWLLNKKEEYKKMEYGKLTDQAITRVLWRWEEDKENENDNADR